MRRALRAQWPAIAERFGVMPWHWDGDSPVLTFGEGAVFVEFLRQQQMDAAFEAAKRELPRG